MSTCNWISVADELPEIGETVLVRVKEYGQSPSRAIARFWRNSKDIKWYMDNEFYQTRVQYEIAEEVTHWCRLPSVNL